MDGLDFRNVPTPHTTFIEILDWVARASAVPKSTDTYQVLQFVYRTAVDQQLRRPNQQEIQAKNHMNHGWHNLPVKSNLDENAEVKKSARCPLFLVVNFKSKLSLYNFYFIY